MNIKLWWVGVFVRKLDKKIHWYNAEIASTKAELAVYYDFSEKIGNDKYIEDISEYEGYLAKLKYELKYVYERKLEKAEQKYTELCQKLSEKEDSLKSFGVSIRR